MGVILSGTHRLCPKCNKNQLLSEFVYGKRACKSCIRAQCREAYKERSVSWPSHSKERRREVRQKHRDKINAWNREYNRRNRSRLKELQHKWAATPSRRMMCLARNRRDYAIKTGLPYNQKAMQALINDPPIVCAFCNSILDYSVGSGKKQAGPSIDRVNPPLGYILGNVAVLCNLCNSRKGCLTSEEHRLFAEFIDKYKS